MKGDTGLEWFGNVGCVLQLWITAVRMSLECD